MLNTAKYVGIGAIGFSVFVVAMGATNPTQQEYNNYAADRLSREVIKAYCKESKVPDFLQDFAGIWESSCPTIITTQRHVIKDFIDESTNRSNYMILSVYKTQVAEYKFETIGAFGQFFTYAAGKK